MKKSEKKSIAVKLLAAFLAGLMVASVVFGLISML